MATASPTPPMSRSDVFIASMTGGAPPGAPVANGDAAPEDAPWQQDLNQILTCPDCREFPPNLVEEFSSGDMVCGSCGVVLGDRIIDTRSEWRTFANDDQNNDDPSRVGDSANPLLNGSQLETSIAFGEGKSSRDLQRAQNKLQKDKSTQTLLAAYREITNFCDAMNISKSIQDAAKHIFKMVDDAKLFKGKPSDAIVAGCIFIACRNAKAPRTFREVFALTKVPKKEIGKIFKQLEKFLQTNPGGIVYLRPEENDTSSKLLAPELCERFCNNLRFKNPHLMARICSELCTIATDVDELSGRSPLSLAAACIYFVAHLMGESRASKAIGNIAGVSDGTIKNAYRYLYPERERLVSEEWIAKGARLDRLPAS